MKNFLFSLFFTLPLVAKDIPQAVVAAAAANQFLVSLDAAQRSKATFPFTAEERENFRFTPRERAGLPLKEMTDAQREATMKLLDSAMSEKGKLKVTQIMAMEGFLAEMENDPVKRDSGKYFVSIYGTPGDPKGWGWRYEGHHLSLNFTLVGGKEIAVTPSFMGANPGEVRSGKNLGLRILAAEEDLARTLVTTLISTGKSSVLFSEKPPNEVITAENRTVTALEPVGIPFSELTDIQRTALLQIISQYTGRYRTEIAAADMLEIEKAGTDKLRFGWAGGIKPGEAYYYRIQGPSFLLEAANVQNNANHMHATWRDFNGDFGRDLLHEHLGADHP